MLRTLFVSLREHCGLHSYGLNGDVSFVIWPQGLTDYYNFDSPDYPNNPFEDYLNRDDVKTALNVPVSYQYSSGNSTVESYLKQDWMQSIAPWLVVLLESYPVMIYNVSANKTLANGTKAMRCYVSNAC